MAILKVLAVVAVLLVGAASTAWYDPIVFRGIVLGWLLTVSILGATLAPIGVQFIRMVRAWREEWVGHAYGSSSTIQGPGADNTAVRPHDTQR